MSGAIAITRQSPYRACQIYQLVADVARYPEFLPYCRAARVGAISEAGDGCQIMQAELVVQYKLLRQAYMSAVRLDSQARQISIDQGATGPFRWLKNHWRFTDNADGCVIDFSLDFEFRLAMLRAMQPARAADRIMAAFEARADALYGGKMRG